MTQTEPIFALFVGRSGSGKSVAAASFPKPFEDFDFDIRANGIKDAVNQGWLNGNDISFQSFDPFGGWIQIESALNNRSIMAKSRQLATKSIAVDSLYSMVSLLDLAALRSRKDGKGTNIGGLAITDPGDYKFEKQATSKIFNYLRVLPCNIIVSAHLVPQWGKRPNAQEYEPNVVIGETLNVTANLAENVLAMFGNVWRFEKKIINNEARHFVQFNTELAKNTYGIPPGEYDITKKEFYPFLLNLIESIRPKSQ